MGTTETDGRKLKIHASLCDMRGATDEKLRRYGRIEVAAAAVVTTPTVQALLSRHAVDISAAGVLELPDGEDVRLELQNGAVHFGAASRPPARPSALVVNGLLAAEAGAEAALLPRVEYLRVNGDVWLPPALFEPFAAVDATYGALRRLPGRRLRELPQAYVDAALLARSPDGVALEDCLTVELAADIPPETIERQLTFSGCGRVVCTREQAAAVAMVSEATGMIGPCDAAGEDGGMDGANTVNAVSYAF